MTQLTRDGRVRQRRPAGERFYKAACIVCQRDFTNRIDRPRKYCSRACSAIGHIKPRKLCERCGQPQADRKKSQRRFCGRTCSDAASRLERPTCHVCGITVGLGLSACKDHRFAARRAKRVRQCVGCGIEYTPYPSAIARGNKYCSFDCYRRVVGLRPAMIEVRCMNCGGMFRRTQAAVTRTTRSFCSRACLGAFNTAENSPGWRGGRQPGYRGPGWVRLADEIRERDGYRCRRCGKSQEEEGKRLSVDHIIPYRSFTDRAKANDRANLVALCRVCHGKKGRAERLWLKGDVLDMWRYQVAVSEPWHDQKRATA